MLHGRAAELADIHGLLADARAGGSSVIVIQGEAGTGKTALLEHVAADAKDFHLLCCTGVESEAELPFAALHLLLLDCLDRLDALPDPQAAALRAAFGLAEAPGVDRFLAGLATLTLLCEVAVDGPLLCLIDDAQWLDRASRDALLFTCRRLGAEGVVLLIAVRDEAPAGDLRGFRVLRLGGLSPSAAAALLAERAADLAPNLRDRLIEEASGNPLALIELAAAVRNGRSPAAGPPAVTEGQSAGGRRVLDAFSSQVDRLPQPTRRALLVSAAEDTGELGVVLAAVDRLGLGLDDFEPAERDGLVRLSNDSVSFRHPLIRSAVYGRSSVSDRAAAHRALADAVPAPEYADRRAWHLAAAAVGYDDHAASAMEDAAVGGNAKGAIQRAGERCEGWLPAKIGPAEIAAGRESVMAYAREAGRDPEAITIGLQSVVCIADSAAQARERFERSTFELFRGSLKNTMMKGVDLDKYLADNLIGTPDEVCAKVAAFGRAGLDAFYATLFVANTVDEMLEQIRLFARYVLPVFQDHA